MREGDLASRTVGISSRDPSLEEPAGPVAAIKNGPRRHSRDQQHACLEHSGGTTALCFRSLVIPVNSPGAEALPSLDNDEQ